MMIVEIMIVAMIVLFTVVGVDYTNLWNWVWVVGGTAVFAFALYYGTGEAIRALSPSMFLQKRFNIARRRRITGGQALRTDEEIRLEAMTDDQLERHIERKPKDALAIEIHADRLKRAGRLADYAREIEYLLTIKSALTVEERCSHYHELAAIFEKLGRPDRARDALRQLVAAHPRHYQATLARRKLAQLDGIAPPPEGYSPADFDVSRMGK